MTFTIHYHEGQQNAKDLLHSIARTIMKRAIQEESLTRNHERDQQRKESE